eukprot:Lankesteria_metandrocarpae@DN454_c0_g1_i1.p1
MICVPRVASIFQKLKLTGADIRRMSHKNLEEYGISSKGVRNFLLSVFRYLWTCFDVTDPLLPENRRQFSQFKYTIPEIPLTAFKLGRRLGGGGYASVYKALVFKSRIKTPPTPTIIERADVSSNASSQPFSCNHSPVELLTHGSNPPHTLTPSIKDSYLQISASPVSWNSTPRQLRAQPAEPLHGPNVANSGSAFDLLFPLLRSPFEQTHQPEENPTHVNPSQTNSPSIVDSTNEVVEDDVTVLAACKIFTYHRRRSRTSVWQNLNMGRRATQSSTTSAAMSTQNMVADIDSGLLQASPLGDPSTASDTAAKDEHSSLTSTILTSTTKDTTRNSSTAVSSTTHQPTTAIFEDALDYFAPESTKIWWSTAGSLNLTDAEPDHYNGRTLAVAAETAAIPSAETAVVIDTANLSTDARLEHTEHQLSTRGVLPNRIYDLKRLAPATNHIESIVKAYPYNPVPNDEPTVTSTATTTDGTPFNEKTSTSTYLGVHYFRYFPTPMKHRDYEAYLLSCLQPHPNITKIYGRVSFGSSAAGILLEHCAHGSLDHIIFDDRRTSKKLSRTKVTKIFADIACGMAHAHKRGILHRDLKLSNILVDSDLNAKVVDFGVGALFNETDSPSILANYGNVFYAAPEVLRGEGFYCASDVYSYGVAFWEALTQRVVFCDSSAGAVYTRVAAGLCNFKFPLNLPSELKALVASTLHSEWTLRPTFGEIEQKLRTISCKAETAVVHAVDAFFGV